MTTSNLEAIVVVIEEYEVSMNEIVQINDHFELFNVYIED
jgi:hypothetical protein